MKHTNAGSALQASGTNARAKPAVTVSDDEVGRFALVGLVINQMANDKSRSPHQRQAAVSDAAQRNKLTAARYSEIEAAAQNDIALQQRIRLAAEAHIKAVRDHQQQR